ncbi:MAG: hypothetical protein HC846_02955, partial [Blastocatellia bacterium]|nr:hypothetical protein [Blastocatellia bacterium]
DLTENLYADIDSSNLKRSFLSTVYQRYELYIHLLMQKQKESNKENFAIQALRVNEKARSRSLLETLRLSEANFVKDAKPELVEREKEIRYSLNQNADKLTDLLSKNAPEGDISQIESEIVSLENVLEEIKAKLKQDSPIYSAIKSPAAFDITQFQQDVLDDNTLCSNFRLAKRKLISGRSAKKKFLTTFCLLEN